MSGTSHERGTGHFIRERLTSILLIPLTVWFIATMVAFIGAEHVAVMALLKDPINLFLMAAFVLISLYHAALGLQMVIEDYLAGPNRRTLLTVSFGAHILVAVVCLYALARLVF